MDQFISIENTTVNARNINALVKAVNACHLLGLQGDEVITIYLSAPLNPLIVIAAPCRDLPGASCSKQYWSDGKFFREVFTVPFHGCRVRWYRGGEANG